MLYKSTKIKKKIESKKVLENMMEAECRFCF